MELAEKHDFVFFAAGFHPEELFTLTEESYAVVCELARHPKCLAVGEIGLDYYWDASHKEEQKALEAWLKEHPEDRDLLENTENVA